MGGMLSSKQVGKPYTPRNSYYLLIVMDLFLSDSELISKHLPSATHEVKEARVFSWIFKDWKGLRFVGDAHSPTFLCGGYKWSVSKLWGLPRLKCQLTMAYISGL